MAALDFIADMTAAVQRGIDVDGMRVVVDGVEEAVAPEASFLSIDFRLAGPGACAAAFTYTFFSGRTVAENLAELADFIRQQNPIAATPPGATAQGASG